MDKSDYNLKHLKQNKKYLSLSFEINFKNSWITNNKINFSNRKQKNPRSVRLKQTIRSERNWLNREN